MIQGTLNFREDKLTVGSCFSQTGGRDFSLISFDLPSFVLHVIHCTPRQTLTTNQDLIGWGNSSSRKFDAQNAYHILLNSKPETPLLSNCDSFSWIWHVQASSRIKHFLWLCVHKRLASKQLILNRHIVQDATCDFCGYPTEDTKHIIRHYPKAIQLWSKIFSYNLLDEWNRLELLIGSNYGALSLRVWPIQVFPLLLFFPTFVGDFGWTGTNHVLNRIAGHLTFLSFVSLLLQSYFFRSNRCSS